MTRILIRSLKETTIDQNSMQCLSQLEKSGVSTCDQLIVGNLSQFARRSQVPYDVLCRWRDLVYEKFGKPFLILKEVKDDWVSHQLHYSTGCQAVDDYLKGGIISGEITQVSGDEATGKTQFCHSFSASVAQNGKKVVYIDTESTFNAERIVNIVKARQPKTNPRPVMELIRVVRIFTVPELFQVLHIFLEETDISALILDSILGLLVPHFNRLEGSGFDQNDEKDNNEFGRKTKKEMFGIVKELVKLLATFRLKNPSLAIVVTNSKSEWFRKTWYNSISRCIVLSVKEMTRKVISKPLDVWPTLSSSSSTSSDSSMTLTVRQLEVKKSIDFSIRDSFPALFPVVITDAGFQDFIP